jgi:hypothetical protein
MSLDKQKRQLLGQCLCRILFFKTVKRELEALTGNPSAPKYEVSCLNTLRYITIAYHRAAHEGSLIDPPRKRMRSRLI